jgi:hypothetical protein
MVDNIPVAQGSRPVLSLAGATAEGSCTTKLLFLCVAAEAGSCTLGVMTWAREPASQHDGEKFGLEIWPGMLRVEVEMHNRCTLSLAFIMLFGVHHGGTIL